MRTRIVAGSPSADRIGPMTTDGSSSAWSKTTVNHWLAEPWVNVTWPDCPMASGTGGGGGVTATWSSVKDRMSNR